LLNVSKSEHPLANLRNKAPRLVGPVARSHPTPAGTVQPPAAPLRHWTHRRPRATRRRPITTRRRPSITHRRRHADASHRRTRPLAARPATCLQRADSARAARARRRDRTYGTYSPLKSRGSVKPGIDRLLTHIGGARHRYIGPRLQCFSDDHNLIRPRPTCCHASRHATECIPAACALQPLRLRIAPQAHRRRPDPADRRLLRFHPRSRATAGHPTHPDNHAT
jgi:hypothetical protein